MHFASERVTSIAIFKLHEESFVRAVHVRMVKIGFLELKADTSPSTTTLWSR
jgi:hypothetical protein